MIRTSSGKSRASESASGRQETWHKCCSSKLALLHWRCSLIVYRELNDPNAQVQSCTFSWPFALSTTLPLFPPLLGVALSLPSSFTPMQCPHLSLVCSRHHSLLPPPPYAMSVYLSPSVLQLSPNLVGLARPVMPAKQTRRVSRCLVRQRAARCGWLRPRASPSILVECLLLHVALQYVFFLL